MELVDINSIKLNPDNPRFIKDYRFDNLVKSLQDFPKMMRIRPVIVNPELMVLGGNMRYRAAKQAGWTQIPIEIVDLTPEEQREFVIKDNINGGDWNWEMLNQDWDKEQLEAWGMELPNDLTLDPNLEWDGMPESSNSDLGAFRQIIVSFKNQDNVDKFAQLIGQRITDKTKSIWYPPDEIGYVADKVYVSKPD